MGRSPVEDRLAQAIGVDLRNCWKGLVGQFTKWSSDFGLIHCSLLSPFRWDSRRWQAASAAREPPQDSSRIAMGEDYEVAYWTKNFGVSRDRLQEAIDAVGNSADAAEAYLKR
jgi:hypothetical protein